MLRETQILNPWGKWCRISTLIPLAPGAHNLRKLHDLGHLKKLKKGIVIFPLSTQEAEADRYISVSSRPTCTIKCVPVQKRKKPRASQSMIMYTYHPRTWGRRISGLEPALAMRQVRGQPVQHDKNKNEGWGTRWLMGRELLCKH